MNQEVQENTNIKNLNLNVEKNRHDYYLNRKIKVTGIKTLT
jgi:hypothetical protein